MKGKIIITVLFGIILVGCAELTQVINTANQYVPAALTTEEIAKGLKEALRVGTDSAVYRLAKPDGFLKDQALKILLPPEAAEIIKYKDKVPGLAPLVDQMELKLNRAAEDAVVEAAPIFKNAIVGLTISDAMGILKGEKNAATQYLKNTTGTQLFNSFNPKIKNSLDKPIVANVSASSTWSSITTMWNKFANSAAGKILAVKTVEVNLSNYVTQKAMDGVFKRVEDQERKIRADVNYRVNETLKKVFALQ